MRAKSQSSMSSSLGRKYLSILLTEQIFIDTDLEGAERSRNDWSAEIRQIENGHVGETPVKHLQEGLRHFDARKIRATKSF